VKYLITLCVVIFAGCASSSYVLHHRPPSKIFSSKKENARIPHKKSIALLYDRYPWVVLEDKMEDGSVWVHYAIAIKNDRKGDVKLNPRSVRIEGKDLTAASAVYNPKDKIGKSFKIEKNSYHRLTAKFHLGKEYVDRFGNSQDPIDLVVPVGDSELRLKLWLWKE